MVFSNVDRGQYRSKTDQIVENLTEMILTGRLENEEVLPPENDMCSNLGISRSIFREAMKVLASKGLIEIRQGLGTIVRAPGENVPSEALSNFIQLNQISPFQIMEVRTPLEIEIAGLAAERRKEKNLEAMRKSLDIMRTNSSDFSACIKADEEFHRSMVASTENTLFVILLRAIGKYFYYLKEVTLQFGVDKVIYEHDAVFQAIESRDSVQARLLMKRHMEATIEDLHRLNTAH